MDMAIVHTWGVTQVVGRHNLELRLKGLNAFSPATGNMQPWELNAVAESNAKLAAMCEWQQWQGSRCIPGAVGGLGLQDPLACAESSWGVPGPVVPAS